MTYDDFRRRIVARLVEYAKAGLVEDVHCGIVSLHRSLDVVVQDPFRIIVRPSPLLTIPVYVEAAGGRPMDAVQEDAGADRVEKPVCSAGGREGGRVCEWGGSVCLRCCCC